MQGHKLGVTFRFVLVYGVLSGLGIWAATVIGFGNFWFGLIAFAFACIDGANRMGQRIGRPAEAGELWGLAAIFGTLTLLLPTAIGIALFIGIGGVEIVMQDARLMMQLEQNPTMLFGIVAAVYIVWLIVHILVARLFVGFSGGATAKPAHTDTWQRPGAA